MPSIDITQDVKMTPFVWLQKLGPISICYKMPYHKISSYNSHHICTKGFPILLKWQIYIQKGAWLVTYHTHEDIMTWKSFPHYFISRASINQIPSQRASDVDLWHFLCCKLEQAVEQTVEWFGKLFVQVSAWCHHATRYYLSRCGLRSRAAQNWNRPGD